jgi:hypothetical protein
MGTMSYRNLRDNLAKVWDKVEDSQERVISTEGASLFWDAEAWLKRPVPAHL